MSGGIRIVILPCISTHGRISGLTRRMAVPRGLIWGRFIRGRSGCPVANRRLLPLRGKFVTIAGPSPALRITGVAERSLPKSGDPPLNPRGEPVLRGRPVLRARRTTFPFSSPDRAERSLRPTARTGTAIVAADHPEPARFPQRKRKILRPRRTSPATVLTAGRGAIAGCRGLWRRPVRLRSAGIPVFRDVAPRMSIDDGMRPVFGCSPPVCDGASGFRSDRCGMAVRSRNGEAGLGRDRLHFVRPVVPT